MQFKIYDDSKNYTCQIIALPAMEPVAGLDNLVKVNVQGNDCLIGKDSDPNVLYCFFCSETALDHKFLMENNLYRHTELNANPDKKGFFENNRRIKAIKFKGVISSGFVIPVSSLGYLGIDVSQLKIGDEFSSIDDKNICGKYYIKHQHTQGKGGNKKEKLLDLIIDSKMAPEHPDTSHLMKNVHKLHPNDTIAITVKLHGTSARYYCAPVNRRLSIFEKALKYLGFKLQEQTYQYVSASRRVIKSVDFQGLPGKKHYYPTDLWTEVGKEFIKDKLNFGESVYAEIIGCDYAGKEIQGGYSYGFNKPEVFVYRIANINPQGIEIDLSYPQMKERAEQLGLKTCPEEFYGKLSDFLAQFNVEGDLTEKFQKIFYEKLLEKPSMFDSSIIEEGQILRLDRFPKPLMLKIKSKKFLLHESAIQDKGIEDIEEGQDGEDIIFSKS